MKKKLASLLMCAVLTASLLVGCGAKEGETPKEVPATEEEAEEKAPEEEKEVVAKVAFISGIINEWNQDLFEQAQKDCAERGYETNIFASDDDYQKESDIVLNCVTQGYDAIVIQPGNPTAIAPALREAVEAGTLVISLLALDEESGLKDIVYEVAFDQFGVGAASAEEYVKQMGEEGKVAILTGNAGAANTEGRTAGIRSVLEQYPGIEIVQVTACDWDRQKAMAAAEDIMTAHPDLTAFFSHDDGMSIGIYEAIKAAGKEEQVKIASIGLTEDGAKYIEEGKILCSVAFPAGAFATPSIKMLDEWLETGTVEPKTVGYYAVTKDNVAEAEW